MPAALGEKKTQSSQRQRERAQREINNPKQIFLPYSAVSSRIKTATDFTDELVYFSTQPSSAVSDKTAETAEDAESAETKKSLVKLFKGSYFIKY